MKTATHGNGRGLDDLFILPANMEERQTIVKWLYHHHITYSLVVSDVEGQDWHGKQLIEIPFGEGLRGVLEQITSEVLR